MKFLDRDVRNWCENRGNKINKFDKKEGNIICLSPKHLRLIKKLLKIDRAFKIEVEVGNVVVVFFLGEGKTGAPAEKPQAMELVKEGIYF